MFSSGLPSHASKFVQSQKQKLKSLGRQLKLAHIKRFRSYNYIQLTKALKAVGVAPGDTLFVHSSYSPYNGFRESPGRVLAALLESIGPNGTLLMSSSPYNTSTEDYAKSAPTFEVKHSLSKMGMLTELFRRRKGTLRSVNPAHPVLVCGPPSEWFIEGHADCPYSCGPGSPFEKLIEVNAKALFFDAELTHLMFFHYLEHTVKDALPFPLYSSETYDIRVFDANGEEKFVTVRPFTKEVRIRRRFGVLEAELRTRGMIRKVRVGNTTLMLVSIRDTLQVTKDLMGRGTLFYDLSQLRA